MPTIQTQKSKIKEVIDTVNWDSQSFAVRQTAGTQHVFDHAVYDPTDYPTVSISHRRMRSRVIDTGYQEVSNTYVIRSMFRIGDRIRLAEDLLDELTTLIIQALVPFMYGNNTYWEILMFEDGSEPYEYVEGIMAKDILITTRHEEVRQTNTL